MGAETILGRGRWGKDTINVFGVKYCDPDCPFNGAGNGRFHCLHHNSNATIEIIGGVTRETVKEFRSQAACVLEE